jgi:hypothetical protein
MPFETGKSELCRVSSVTRESLNLNLRRFVSDYFGDPFVVAYLSRHANVLARVRFLRFAKLRAVTPPDQHREDLAWVWLVEIDKCRISTTPCDVMRAGHLPTNSCRFANMILGLPR